MKIDGEDYFKDSIEQSTSIDASTSTDPLEIDIRKVKLESSAPINQGQPEMTLFTAVATAILKC